METPYGPIINIQMDNYFDLLHLPIQYHINRHTIDQKYFELQHSMHPDVIEITHDEHYQSSVEKLSIMNDAYKTLSNDLLRAEHILKLYDMINDRDIPSNILDMLHDPKSAYDTAIKNMSDAFNQCHLQDVYNAWLICKYLQRYCAQ